MPKSKAKALSTKHTASRKQSTDLSPPASDKAGQPATKSAVSKSVSSKTTVVDSGAVSLSRFFRAGISRYKLPSLKTYQANKARPRIKKPIVLPSVWWIARRALVTLWNNWKLFLGLTLIYTVLTILLVRGFSSGVDVGHLKSVLGSGSVGGGLVAFGVLATSSSNAASQVAGVYQTFLAVLVSLAVIWALRQVFAGTENIRVRDAFYRGMYPLIPVLLVLLAIGVQLLPMVVSASLYSTIVRNGIAVTLIERLMWGLGALLLTSWSLYMIVSSVFALYIAALPDMTPMKALRSAQNLVRFRRWMVLRKLLFLPLGLLVGSVVIMLPVIFIATSLAPWLLLVLTMLGLPIIHAYVYTLYRELLK